MNHGGKRPGAGRPSNAQREIAGEVAEISADDRHRLIQSACRAATNVLLRSGLEPGDIANGFISFGGAMAMELTGVEMTADVFQSKADALRGQVRN